MQFDNHANFAYGTVLTAPAPALTGLSLVLSSGAGALFPVAPFNITVWPAGQNPTKTNSEIIRCTNRITDTLTILRSQEGSGTRSILVGDQVALTATAKMFTDIENLVQPASIRAYYKPFSTVNGVFFTAISINDGTTVLTARAAISATLGNFYYADQALSGDRGIIARWDEGVSTDYKDEVVVL